MPRLNLEEILKIPEVYKESKFRRNPQNSRRYNKTLNLEENLKIPEGRQRI
jgi:hypothetical protein